MDISKDKRKSDRVDISLVTFIRKTLPNGNHTLLQFKSKDLSTGGVFITSEDLAILDIGEDCELLFDEKGEKFLQATARVVRGARFFSDSGEQELSGYGLMFYEPDSEFLDTVKDMLLSGKPGEGTLT